MLNVISTALSIGGAVTGTSTSWIAILSAVILSSLLWAYDERLKAWIQGINFNISVKNFIERRLVWRVLQIVAAFVLVWIAVILSNISILRPNVFIGYTDQAPFKFGRYIASIGRSADPPGGYCPEAIITGDVGNTTDDQMQVWYGGAPISISTQSPSVSFNGALLFAGISPANGSHTNIEAGSAVPVTFTAHMNPSLCKDYKDADLEHLRRARINASTEIYVTNVKTKTTSAQAITFRDLPIALGD